VPKRLNNLNKAILILGNIDLSALVVLQKGTNGRVTASVLISSMAVPLCIISFKLPLALDLRPAFTILPMCKNLQIFKPIYAELAHASWSDRFCNQIRVTPHIKAIQTGIRLLKLQEAV